MNLEEIIQQSVESELLAVECVAQQIILKIYHDDLERIVTLKLPYISFYSTFRHQKPEVCFIKIEKIASKLDIENGVFVAAKNFPDFMSQVREGLHLAYGLGVSQYTYFFQLIGTIRVVIPLKSLDDLEYIVT